MKLIAAGMLSAVLLSLTGCSVPRVNGSGLETAIVRRAAGESIVHMAEVAPFAWDYVIISPPYSRPSGELRTRGVSFRAGDVPDRVWNDSRSFFMFVRGADLVESFWIRRTEVDFGRSNLKVIYRTNDAVRAVRVDYPEFSVLHMEKVE